MSIESLDDDPLLASAPRLADHPVLPPCLIYGFIGRGGMGAVYLAHHLRLGLDVAVKCLHPEIARQSGTWVQRFHREASLAARVSHQNLVRAYDVLRYGDLHYLVMELVEGENLRQRVQRLGALPIDEAVAIIGQAAAGLAAAHEAGVVHRDIKPDNVLISQAGVVKVADLGLAKALEALPEEALTTLGTTTMGTPQYMAPEQWEDTRSVGPAADVFALGATLWFLLAGRDARPKSNLREALRRTLQEPFPDLRQARPDVPDALAACLDRATSTEPSQRPSDAAEFLKELSSAVPPRMLRHEQVSHPSAWTPPAARPKSKHLDSARAGLDGLASPVATREGDAAQQHGKPTPAARASAARRRAAAWRYLPGAAILALVIAATLIIWAPDATEDTPAVPARIQVEPPIVVSAADQAVLDVLRQPLHVDWAEWTGDEILGELTRLTQLPMRRDTPELDEELDDNDEQTWALLTIYGTTTAEQILDVLCAGDDHFLHWRIAADGVELRDGPRPATRRLYGIYPLTNGEERLDPEDVLHLVRENIAISDDDNWDLFDAYTLDFFDNNSLLAIHHDGIHQEIEAFMNRLLNVSPRAERALLQQREARLSTVVEQIPKGASTVFELSRQVADALQAAVIIDNRKLDDLMLSAGTMVATSSRDQTVRDLLRAIREQSPLTLSLLDTSLALTDDLRGEHVTLLHDISDFRTVDQAYEAEDFNLLPSGTNPEWFSEGVPDESPVPFYSTESLTSAICDNIKPDTWTADPECSITRAPGLLIVRHTVETQAEIVELLDSWRAIQAAADDR